MPTEPTEAIVTGFDTTAIDAWIGDKVDALRPPCSWTLLRGGHSNLTALLVDSDGRRAVVRRPPLVEVRRGAHDMEREYRIVGALRPSCVPVPEAYGYCSDPSVTGAPFSVVSFVDGRALSTTAEIEAWLPPRSRAAASEEHIDVLAELHRLSPDEVGLGSLATRRDYVSRQLHAWYESWTSSIVASGYDDPRVHEVHDFLSASCPDLGPRRLVHGDYGLHNCLFTREGRVAALLDWEVCTLGPPLADVAFVLNRWSVADDMVPGREPLPDGFLSRAELLERYQRATAADLSDLDYYVLLNHWRSACIAQGVYARYVTGGRPPDGVDIEHFRSSIRIRLEQAVATRARLG